MTEEIPMNKTLILKKILGAALLTLCIIATVVLHDFTILVFCAPFYLSGLFSKENVLCISENGQTAEVSNGSDISDKTNRQGCDKAV